MTDHAGHRDDVGAYLLGALNDLERQAFERHLRDCGECQDELERLRPAAEALPGSVPQLTPPPGLKKRLMAEVEPPRRVPSRMLAVAAVLLIGLVVAFGVSQLGSDGSHTVTATVAKALPRAGGKLSIEGDRATLQLHDMPQLDRARVYQVWLKHGDRLVPARTFEVGGGGVGNVRLPDIRDAEGVYVTREAHGGAQVPSEDPIVSVPL